MRWGGAKQRRDVSEPDIIAALRSVGAFVKQVNGRDCPDLIIRWQGRWYVAEVKSEGGAVSPGQREAQYPILRNRADALRLIGISLDAMSRTDGPPVRCPL